MPNLFSLPRSLKRSKNLASALIRRALTARTLPSVALAATLLLLLGTAAARTHKLARRSAVYTVTATAYEAVASQTDSRPFITADNSHIPKGYGSHTHWLALSRDLLRPWGGPFEFGDKVRVRGVSRRFDGVYTVHDTMNRRYRHRLDVLVHPRERISLHQPGVQLQRLFPQKPATKALRQVPRTRKLGHGSKVRPPARTPRKIASLTKRRGAAKAAKPAHAQRKRLPPARHKSNTKNAHSKR